MATTRRRDKHFRSATPEENIRLELMRSIIRWLRYKRIGTRSKKCFGDASSARSCRVQRTWLLRRFWNAWGDSRIHFLTQLHTNHDRNLQRRVLVKNRFDPHTASPATDGLFAQQRFQDKATTYSFFFRAWSFSRMKLRISSDIPSSFSHCSR